MKYIRVHPKTLEKLLSAYSSFVNGVCDSYEDYSGKLHIPEEFRDDMRETNDIMWRIKATYNRQVGNK
jgi:hypothetical protein